MTVKTVQRRAVIEARVLAALETLLGEETTFTDLSVEQIATAANMSRSTFYLYFADKTELLVRLSVPFKAGIFDVGRDWSPQILSLDLGELTQLYESVVAHMRLHVGLLAAITEFAAHDPVVREAWTGGEEQFVTRIARWLAESENAHVDPLVAARIMVWGCEQVMVRQVLTGTAEEDADVMAELAASHWYGTFQRPATNLAFRGRNPGVLPGESGSAEQV